VPASTQPPAGHSASLARALGWACLVPIVLLAVQRGWWAPDEPRYAQVAREAYESGSLIVMHLCGELYPDKPPLVYWLAGLCGSLANWSEFAMRLPSLLATAGTAWISMRLARRFFGELEAAWVVLFFLGTVMVTEIGGRLQLDPVLTFLCFGALDLLVRDEERVPAGRALAAGLLLGLAALAKGPVAWTHVGFALLGFALLPAALRRTPRLSLAGWLALVGGAILPVAGWAALAIQHEPALLKPLLFGQHVGRITAGTQHRGPLWNHITGMTPLLLPWTFLVLAGLGLAWREFRAARAAPLANPWLVRLAGWFALEFAFFSIIPVKRDLYLLPLYPVAALLAARCQAEFLRRGRSAAWVACAPAVVLLLAGAILVAASNAALVEALAARFAKAQDAAFLVGFGPGLLAVGLCLAAGGIAALLLRRRSHAAGPALAAGAGFLLASVAAGLFVVPRLDRVKSAREFALLIAARPEKPTLIPCEGVHPEGYRFYAGIPAGRAPILSTLESEGERYLALAEDFIYERLTDAERARVTILERGRVGSREVLLLGRAPQTR